MHYLSYVVIGQSWQLFLATKDLSLLDLWRDNMYLINTFHGQTELNMKLSGGVVSNHSKVNHMKSKTD